MTEKMKPSGIAWIGDVPESWEICRIKDLCTIARGGSPRPIDEYLSDNPSDINWIRIGDTTKGNKYITQTEQKIIKQGISSSRMVYDGDLLLTNSMSFGQPYIMKTCGCIHDGWLVFSDYHRIDKLFLYYVLMSELCLVQFKTSVAGAVVENLSIDKVGISKIFLPSLEEQGAIVNFLDTQCAKIDGVIADIEKQIEILQKYKKSLITEAVTKGLKPDIPMRSSKVEYVSSVPDHWEEKRLNIVAYVRARLGWRGLTADEYVDEGYAFLSAFNIVDDKLDLSEELLNYITKFRYDESPEIKLHSGDVLLVKDGAGLGKCARIDDLPFETAPNGSLAVITPNEQLHYRYLYYFFVGDVFQQRINQIKNGMGVPHLPQGDLRKIVVPIPPMDEQIAISDYLDERCAIVDPLIEEKEKQLETMKQHKKSLIYEYVTGKKRVTEVN